MGASEWEVVWLELGQMADYFHPDVDSNQVRRLSDQDRDIFLRQAGRAMERLGYSTELEDSKKLPVILSIEAARKQRLGALQAAKRNRRAA